MIDSHVHTHYSHGKAEVFEMVAEAIKRGLSGIGFAEHFHYDYFNGIGLPTVSGRSVEGTPLERFELYYQSAMRAREYYQGKIEIGIGVEVDYLSDKKKEIKLALEGKDSVKKFVFDFIMGSVHFIGSPLKYFSDYAENGEDWLINEYFNLVKDCVSLGLFDIIAHPELIKFFINKPEEYYRKHLEELVELFKKYKVAVDVNTDYMKNSKTGEIIKERINPGLMMLKLCQEKKIPLVLGSDAHRPEKLANNFEVATELLRYLGVKRLFYFKDRELLDYTI